MEEKEVSTGLLRIKRSFKSDIYTLNSFTVTTVLIRSFTKIVVYRKGCWVDTHM